eukprot:gnl/TRDRNA2_/TRDRNA2_176834_c0_seq2.p1 gnl/TRDRNA2_/TRDRNA2_176834_c0~~gnl/TRDRNA2_/TRDRNA2_176834_c0_seq2.p1  ORF type:complete len:790 (-),score=152.76 gnl/TRDRNA2_/TRDRNA2_176834_c0_seq2:259-2379(-)
MKRDPPDMPFFPKDSKPALLTTLLMGLQHMLAMLVGVITPPRLMANEGCLLGRDADLCAVTPHLICSALLASGLLSIMQIMRVRLMGGYYFGTGLISVMGTSFTFLPIGQQMIQEATLAFPAGSNGTGIEWYGKFIGTCMVASLIEVLLSFVPPKILKKICPPVVTGTVVFCIGAALTQTGIMYWGGGVFCASNTWSRGMMSAEQGNRFIMGPQSCMADNGGERGNPLGGEIVAGKAPPGMQGFDAYFGDPTYVAYGFIAMLIFVIIATFGSPFMRSCNIAISFLLGYAIAAGATFEDVVMNGETYTQKLVTGMFATLTGDKSPISFLWVGTASAPGMSIGFAPEYFLPILICFFISTAESIGDITATAGASKEPTDGKVINERIQGGLLADGVNSFLACLFLTPPNTTFSQNTGVISMTNCASRAAGFACCGWLILAGIFVPFGAFLADAPTCVLGGIVTILFCSIMVSGIKILGRAPRTTRNHLIMAISLGVGLGVSGVPHMLKGGGNASFYGAVLQMNTGMWPLKDCCVPGTEVLYSASFPAPGPFGDYFASQDLNFGIDANNAAITSHKGMVNTNQGFHRGKYLLHPHSWVAKCEIDASKKAWRSAILLMLNTPYCIGFIVAVILNLLLPQMSEAGDEVQNDKGDTAPTEQADKIEEGLLEDKMPSQEEKLNQASESGLKQDEDNDVNQIRKIHFQESPRDC